MNKKFISIISNPLKFKLFLFKQLPAAYFAGLKVIEINEERCTVSVPYKWMTKNPFKSTYFASLAMAAELSTGALAMAYTLERKPKISMLVVNINAGFFKKAVGITLFTCEDGKAMAAAIEDAVKSGQGQTFTATANGINEAGEAVAQFKITWSFKAKQ